jgi:hypothetical protein
MKYNQYLNVLAIIALHHLRIFELHHYDNKLLNYFYEMVLMSVCVCTFSWILILPACNQCLSPLKVAYHNFTMALETELLYMVLCFNMVRTYSQYNKRPK